MADNRLKAAQLLNLAGKRVVDIVGNGEMIRKECYRLVHV